MPRNPAPPADPLADLREPDPVVIQVPIAVQVDGTSTLDQRRAAMITAWHADPVAQSFGHGGGTCGCLYLANAALKALGALDAPEPEPEPVQD